MSVLCPRIEAFDRLKKNCCIDTHARQSKDSEFSLLKVRTFLQDRTRETAEIEPTLKLEKENSHKQKQRS